MSLMCRLYGVTRAGYYAWKRRGPSARAEEDERLRERIHQIYQASRATYGSPRIHQALRAVGERVGKKRVARLMRDSGLKARVAKLYRATPGLDTFFAEVPNRQLGQEVSGRDQVWVGDLTYLRVGQRWRYLAVVMDKYSRRILGWSLGPHRDVALTLKALNRAVSHRHPGPGGIFHTDRGIEYAAYAFRARLAELGLLQSMNRPGELNDNAHMESFFHSLKAEVIHGKTFAQDDEVRSEIRSYIPFYNQVRLHSALGYLPPVVYEQQAA